jgi:hypothetical protein
MASSMEGPNITVISDPSPEELDQLDLSSSSSEDCKVTVRPHCRPALEIGLNRAGCRPKNIKRPEKEDKISSSLKFPIFVEDIHDR